MTREEVYKEIDRERAYQQSLGITRTDGCNKTVGDFIVLLEYYAAKARNEWTEHAGTLHARHVIRKLTACAIACLELHDCPSRKSADVATDRTFTTDDGGVEQEKAQQCPTVDDRRTGSQ